MKLTGLAAIASGLALTATLVAPTTAAAAPALPALVPSAVKPKVVATAKIDVDGDGRKDTVKVTKLSSTKYKVTVSTAKKKTSSLTITSTIKRDWGEDNPYWGAAKLDKVKGHELLLLTGGGDGVVLTVLTWRDGKLVRQAAPKARNSKYAWYSLTYPDFGAFGYRFYNKDQKRYVEQYGLFLDGNRWKGEVVTSKWTSTGWKKVGKTKTVSLTKTQAKKKYPGGFTGVKIVQP